MAERGSSAIGLDRPSRERRVDAWRAIGVASVSGPAAPSQTHRRVVEVEWTTSNQRRAGS